MDKMLGYIELETGSKLITPLNDTFLNWTFDKEEYREHLRMITNILYNAYKEANENTTITPIENEMTVTTQFPYYKDVSSTRPNTLDMRIEDIKKINFIDFQNEPHSSDPPVPIRSTKYLGFILTRGEDKQSASMWVLNGTISELLNGKIFANFVLMDEQDYHPHPIDVNILYVDIKMLAKQSSKAGELARVLTGVENDPKDEDVKKILQGLKQSFNVFKNCTEVKNMMTRAEELKAKGEAKGIAEKARKVALKMLQDGFPVCKIAEYVEMPVTWVNNLAN